MTKIQIKALRDAVKTGFTFVGDSIYSTRTQARRAINSLVREGYLEPKVDSDGRTEYLPTELAWDFVRWGVPA